MLSGVRRARSTTVVSVAATAAKVGHRRARSSARDGKHVQDDLDLEGAAGIRCEARLEAVASDEHDGQGDSPVAAREQTPWHHEQRSVSRECTTPLLSLSGRAASRQQTIFGLTPEGDAPANLTSGGGRKTALARDATDIWRSNVRPMRCRRPLILVSAVAGTALSLLAAGCGGGGGSPGVATVVSSATCHHDDAASGVVAYSSCMRSHGVPGFPDPTAPGTSRSPRCSRQEQQRPPVRRCQQCLQRPASEGGLNQGPTITRADQLDYLKAAACMRRHGSLTFPTRRSRTTESSSTSRRPSTRTLLWSRARCRFAGS